MKQRFRSLFLILPVLVLLTGVRSSFCQETRTPPGKSFVDYFLPMPINGSLSKGAWGAAEVGARDQKNGLEDATMTQWDYWDGQIIKAPDGKYHMFASRWDQAKGHREWGNSRAIHAVSDKLTGPYVDKGLCWPNDQGGKGHNVTALVLPDGRYGVVISETRPGTVFVSKSLDGPWEQLGIIKGDGLHASNISIMVRPDGDFMIVPRSGQVFISKAADGILGPYKSMGPSVFPKGIPNLEDPAIFYSGGLYHIVVNSWSTRKAYHLTSKDGKSHWVNRGLAYDPTRDFIRYTDGTVNHWHKLERPGVLIENGHVTAMTLAVLDTPKEEQPGNNGHGSKIIVVLFDGAALDRDLQADIRRISLEGKEGVPAPVAEPGKDGIDRIHKVETPSLELFPTTQKPARGTIMVCPGGGYGILAINHEGYFVAKKLNEFGYDVAILLYHVSAGNETRELAIADAKAALTLLQKRGGEFGFSTRKIGVMGFSAGGHLAARLTHATATDTPPDFVVLMYPAYLEKAGKVLDEVAPVKTPAFVYVAGDDKLAPSSIAYAEACQEAKVPCDFTKTEHGGHGFGLKLPLPQDVKDWPNKLHVFLDGLK